MASGVDSRRPSEASSEASSDASLWEDMDDTNSAIGAIITPRLQIDTALPTGPVMDQLITDPHRISSIDTQTDRLPRQQDSLTLELFPSGQSSAKLSDSRPHPPSSFDFDAAAAIEPWTQPDFKATQYLRDEWLISAGQKQPNDLVYDFAARRGQQDQASTSKCPRLAPTENIPSSNMSSSSKTACATPARSDVPTNSGSTAKRGRSSLLDQLDAICSSPSQHFSSSPTTNANEPPPPSIPKSAGLERQPLAPASSIASNGRAPSVHQVCDEDSVIDVLDMPSSPPSQPIQHITLIKDMPQELQNIYRRLAFGGSNGAPSSTITSTPLNHGTTARGTRGKTWQTTWQHDDHDAQQTSGAAGTSSKSNGAASTCTPISSSRGRKTTNSIASKATRTHSRASSSRGKGRFFAAKPSRGRARGRGRGRARARGQ